MPLSARQILSRAVQVVHRKLKGGRQAVLEAALLFQREARWPELVTCFDEKVVLILAPHMDDEVIGCGGVAIRHQAAGAKIFTVFVTDGRNGDARLLAPGFDRESQVALQRQVVETRRQEACKAASILGTSRLIFLEAEDGHLKPDPQLERQLAEYLGTWRPDLVYLPSPFDSHVDHWQTIRLFVAATKAMPETWQQMVRVRCYEVWSPLMANRLVEISGVMDQKQRALAAHQSQLREWDYQRCVEGLNAYRAIALPGGKGFAEAFFECSMPMLTHLVRRITL